MIAFVTVLLVISILIWPVSFVVALIYKLFKVKKISESIYPGISDNGEYLSENKDAVK